MASKKLTPILVTTENPYEKMLKDLDMLEIAAAYVRVSTDDQTELSPDAQIRVIREAAKADGYFIPEEYIFIEKKGVSGRRADNRQEFQRMIATAKSQDPAPFKRLYLWKFSRFARNQEESTFYKGILRKKCGVEIKSVSEPIMEGMFGRLIETIIEWFDEYYSFNLSGEVLRGMTEKVLREGYQSAPSLGYEAVGGGNPFVICESEYSVVEYIHQTYHNGADMTAIARYLNEHGFRTKRGNLFDKRAIEGILTNKFYIGVVEWNGYVFNGSHECRPSVVTIFDENQERIKKEFKPKGRREVSACQHWVSGILKCGYCGASMGYNKSRNTGRNPSFFQCWKYAKGFHKESCSITARKVENAIFESLRMAAADPQVKYEYVRESLRSTPSQASELENALSRLAVKESRIKAAYENGIDTLEEYRDNKSRLLKEREELEIQLEELSNGPIRNEEEDRKELQSRIKTTMDLLANPNIDYETKGNALRGIVKKIIYDKEHGVIKCYYYISI